MVKKLIKRSNYTIKQRFTSSDNMIANQDVELSSFWHMCCEFMKTFFSLGYSFLFEFLCTDLIGMPLSLTPFCSVQKLTITSIDLRNSTSRHFLVKTHLSTRIRKFPCPRIMRLIGSHGNLSVSSSFHGSLVDVSRTQNHILVINYHAFGVNIYHKPSAFPTTCLQ